MEHSDTRRADRSSPGGRKIPLDLLNAPPRVEKSASNRPTWSKGFRPFFIAAAVHAVLSVPLWLAAWVGTIDIGAYWAGPFWHGHEMIFGFAIAVIAGFLLTAVGNWTRQETAIGKPLMALVGLWIAGRLAITFAAILPAGLVAAVDLAFVPALAVAIGRPLLRTKNKRNFLFLGIMAAFTVANLFMHLDALGWVAGAAQPALIASLDLVILVTLVIGGRVIPMFTRNATGNQAVRHAPLTDRATLVGMLLVLVTAASGISDLVTGSLAAVVGVLVFARMRHWGTFGTLRQPILWVLHLGHAWIGVGLLLRAGSLLGLGVAPTFATHVLTIGAIGTLILGMMTRVALGHTGRPLTVAPSIVVAYVLVTLAVAARALLPLVLPSTTWIAYFASAVLWCLAFAIFLWKYLPILVSPRVD